jgi:hypothetical protein
VVGGYVRKRVTLQISKGLRAVALAAGISRIVYSDTRVIFITIIAIYIALAEKIGTPLFILVSDSSVSSVSIQKLIPVDSFLFQSYTEKATHKIRVLSSFHRLDCIEVFVLVASFFCFCGPFYSFLSFCVIESKFSFQCHQFLSVVLRQSTHLAAVEVFSDQVPIPDRSSCFSLVSYPSMFSL